MGYLGYKPADKPLTAADIADSSITSAKIVDATITNSDVASSIITGQTAETSIADADTLLIYDNSATALRKMTKANFVSGLGGSTPAFFVTMFGRGSDQTGLPDNADTKVQFTTETFDTDSAYDNSTNYRFTVPSGKDGKYFFSATVNSLRSGANPRSKYVSIYKNGGQIEQNGLFMASTSVFEGSQDCTINCTTVLNLVATDYIEVYFRQYDGTSGIIKHNVGNHFYGYRISGV
jgi:hypothetical protein